MENYPLYNVDDCFSYIEYLEYIYKKFKGKVAFEYKKRSYSYDDIYLMVRQCLLYFESRQSDKYKLSIEDPMLFFIAYFSVVISGGIAFLSNGQDILKYDNLELVDESKIKHILKEEKIYSTLNDFKNRNDIHSVCTIALSSGTTSVQKGVMLSQANILTDMVAGMKIYEYAEDRRYLSVLPCYHLFGLVADLLGPLYSGSTICIPENKISFFSDLQYFKPTNLNLPPALVMAIYKLLVSTNDFSVATGGKLKKIMAAGAKLDEFVNDEFKKYGMRAYSGYGLTECSPCVSMNRDNYFREGSSGVILPCCEVKIVNGEILVKGNNVMLGYYQSEKDTARVIHDGWLHTGDLGKIDDDGFLILYGRLSNIIVFENGKKIIPENVEYEINSIKEVEESLVTSFESNNSIYLDITVVCKNKSVENKIKEICEKYDVLHKINNICITDNKLKRNKLGKLVRNNCNHKNEL